MLIVNFNSSFYFGRSYSDYLERLPDAIDPWDYITSINTEIKDWNQAYALEADYIKNWENGRLTAGASYTSQPQPLPL